MSPKRIADLPDAPVVQAVPEFFHQASAVDSYAYQGRTVMQQFWHVEDRLGLRHLVRVEIEYDPYPVQSHAKASLWLGSGWVPLYTYLDALVRTPTRPSPVICFGADTRTLLRMARMILSGGVLDE